MRNDNGRNRSKSPDGLQQIVADGGGDDPVRKGEEPTPLSAPHAEEEAPSHDSRALFVTRPADFSVEKLRVGWDVSGKVLLHGLDSLDVGLFVEWDHQWPVLARELERGKRKAAGTEGILSSDGRCLIRPSGKPPRYRWHLQFPDFHAFVGTRPSPARGTPNVLVSLSSRLLWNRGARGAVESACEQIRALGGRVADHKLSRVDPCIDLQVSRGLTFEFLHSQRVPSHRRANPYFNGVTLETYYVGARGAEIQLRIYDKGTEIAVGGEKSWFLDLWNVADGRNVWRVEFQLRRPALKQFGINSLDDLEAKLPGVWQYLATEWFSLRLPDDENATRRTVHPFWATVQDCAKRFGEVVDVRRQLQARLADPRWYVQHIAGCLVGFAVCVQKSTLRDAMKSLESALDGVFSRKDFGELYRIKEIQSGNASGKDAA